VEPLAKPRLGGREVTLEGLKDLRTEHTTEYNRLPSFGRHSAVMPAHHPDKEDSWQATMQDVGDFANYIGGSAVEIFDAVWSAPFLAADGLNQVHRSQLAHIQTYKAYMHNTANVQHPSHLNRG